MKLEELIKELNDNRNTENALQMKKYMKDKFEFLGIKSQELKRLSKDYIKTLTLEDKVNWHEVFTLFNLEFREYQYIALMYLEKIMKRLTIDDLDNILKLTKTKSHWDSVDSIDQLLGDIALRNDKVKPIILKWSKDENYWVRRLTIDHQLRLKKDTDTDLLEKIIANNLNQKEFFINKAIGWALREYSKVDKMWVSDFINRYNEGLAPLSIREGSKYLD